MLQITVIIGLTTRYKYLFECMECVLDVFMGMNVDNVRSDTEMRVCLPHIDFKVGFISS